MATDNKTLTQSFTLDQVIEAFKLGGKQQHGIVADLIGVISHMGVSTKQIDVDRWTISYITDERTIVINLNLQFMDYHYTVVNGLDGSSDVQTSELNAEGLWELMLNIETNYSNSYTHCA